MPPATTTATTCCRRCSEGDRVVLRQVTAATALHRAAAALYRGLAGQGAGRIRHRPALDLRLDHLDAARPRVRRNREPPLHRDRHRQDRLPLPDRALPPLRRLRLHRRDGGRARRRLARRGTLDHAAVQVLEAVHPSRSRTSRRTSRASRWRRRASSGSDPASGKPMSVRMGRFGPFVQIGTKDDEEKPRFAGLRPGQKMDTITLEQALELFKLPRTLGTTAAGDPVVANIGRFGPYIKYGDKYVSLKDDPYTVTLERALECIRLKQEADANRIIQDFGVDNIQVLNGRYGPYISNKEKNARMPKDREPKIADAGGVPCTAGGGAPYAAAAASAARPQAQVPGQRPTARRPSSRSPMPTRPTAAAPVRPELPATAGTLATALRVPGLPLARHRAARCRWRRAVPTHTRSSAYPSPRASPRTGRRHRLPVSRKPLRPPRRVPKRPAGPPPGLPQTARSRPEPPEAAHAERGMKYRHSLARRQLRRRAQARGPAAPCCRRCSARTRASSISTRTPARAATTSTVPTLTGALKRVTASTAVLAAAPHLQSEELRHYCEAIGALRRQFDGAAVYPGSPWLAAQALRAQDRGLMLRTAARGMPRARTCARRSAPRARGLQRRLSRSCGRYCRRASVAAWC